MKNIIRWMAKADLPKAVDMERLMDEDCPLTERDLVATLRTEKVIGMVVEDGAANILGYVIYEIFPKKIAILHLCAWPDNNYSKVITSILNMLKAKLKPGLKEMLTFNVRERNLMLQQILRAEGFNCCKVLRGHFRDTEEDAFLFHWRLKSVVRQEMESEEFMLEND